MTNQKIGRLAMRDEGDYWNAYYAMPDTMEGAILLGSIAMRFIDDNELRKSLFMELMKQAVGDIIEPRTGGTVTWPNDLQTAPHHQRAAKEGMHRK